MCAVNGARLHGPGQLFGVNCLAWQRHSLRSAQIGQWTRCPNPGEAAKDTFSTLVPSHAGVSTRQMFGNQAAFVNGDMFAGLFGDRLFVRLSDEDRPTG